MRLAALIDPRVGVLPAKAATRRTSHVSGRTAADCGFRAQSADSPFRRGDVRSAALPFGPLEETRVDARLTSHLPAIGLVPKSELSAAVDFEKGTKQATRSRSAGTFLEHPSKGGGRRCARRQSLQTSIVVVTSNRACNRRGHRRSSCLTPQHSIRRRRRTRPGISRFRVRCCASLRNDAARHLVSGQPLSLAVKNA
jgi:hypothetical protein